MMSMKLSGAVVYSHWSITTDGKVVLEDDSGLIVEIAQNVRYYDGLSELLVVSMR